MKFKSLIPALIVFLAIFAVVAGPSVVFSQPFTLDDPLAGYDPEAYNEENVNNTGALPPPGTNPSPGLPPPGVNPSDGPGIPNPLAGNVTDIISFVRFVLTNIVLPIGVVIVVFFVIYSGFLFVTAQGNASKLEDARKTFLWVVVGAAILLGSVVIAEAIKTTVCKISPTSCYPAGFVGPR